ncbi:hypothetical protein CYY_010354 [Polysphondylium violaceum]|uniref:Uncharacterized protein n=1 Tax=Polysphondylium violaceum TaxID=133409 RepID=A0A8J4PJX0_9MYCE|nr:hypothetical protein CYY_010354 [Polysphondylium violaceum]
MCVHDDIYIPAPNTFNYQLFEDLTGDLDNFPLIGNGCTEKCKKKMIKIIKILMKSFTQLAIGYFQDAKLGLDRSAPRCDLVFYISYIQENGVDDDEDFIEIVESAMNVKSVNGEVVHLKQDDTQSQDLSNLTKNGKKKVSNKKK